MGSVKCHVAAGASAAVKVLKGSRSPPYKLQPQVLEPMAFKSRVLLFVLRNTFWICVGAETLCAHSTNDKQKRARNFLERVTKKPWLSGSANCTGNTCRNKTKMTNAR
ncbi:Acetamidase [Fusarium oxysporum f. sp. albedinis]|nr:Acetamidase [Fusarium oxysporum f. sp. albedinis]